MKFKTKKSVNIGDNWGILLALMDWQEKQDGSTNKCPLVDW